MRAALFSFIWHAWSLEVKMWCVRLMDQGVSTSSYCIGRYSVSPHCFRGPAAQSSEDLLKWSQSMSDAGCSPPPPSFLRLPYGGYLAWEWAVRRLTPVNLYFSPLRFCSSGNSHLFTGWIVFFFSLYEILSTGHVVVDRHTYHWKTSTG